VAAVVLIATLALRPSLTLGRPGKALAFLAFFLLPGTLVTLGVATHLDHATRTEFCLSCHVMEDYGRSLQVDDGDYLAAVHYQNALVDRDHACYTCHKDYTMFGDMNAKLRGLKHLYVNYLGTVPEELALYGEYQNRECLHCHRGARSYFEAHDEGELAENASGEVSCLECHDFIHETDNLENVEVWQAHGGSR